MAKMVSFDIDDDLFKTYIFYSSVLALKVLAMSVLTARQRFTKMVFSNPEDAKGRKVAKVKYDDADVERVRRAHLNDLENIPLFTVVCFGYLLAKPNVFLATNLIRLFVASRIIHTLVYAVFVVRQPARFLAFAVGFATTIYMAIQVILTFL